MSTEEPWSAAFAEHRTALIDWWPNLHSYGHIPKMDGLAVESCCIFYLGNTHIKNRYHQIGRETGFWDVGELMLPMLQYGNGTIFPCVAVFSSSLYSFLSAFDGSYLLPTSSDLSPTCHWNRIFNFNLSLYCWTWPSSHQSGYFPLNPWDQIRLSLIMDKKVLPTDRQTTNHNAK